MSFGSFRYSGLVGVLAGALLLQSACASEADTVGARVVVVDRTTQSLILVDLLSVNGTYTNCRGRGDNDPWSVKVDSNATLSNAALTVLLNDSGCQLTLTELVTQGDGGGILAAAMPIVLDEDWGAATTFGTQVYATAQIDPISFSGAVTLQILFSDTLTPNDVAVPTTLAVVQSTATAESVPAPNYTLDITDFVLTTDSNDVVQSFAGNAVLTPVSVFGNYVLVQGIVGPSYANVAAAFDAGTDVAIPAFIDAGDFMISGDLTGAPLVRTLIIANTVNTVTSYQVFALTFSASAVM